MSEFVEIIDTQSARHRVDHGTICGRSCANSEHYKPLCACVDRTFVNSPSPAPWHEFFLVEIGLDGLFRIGN
jgi:hypothetical protein